jgi:ferredoxin
MPVVGEATMQSSLPKVFFGGDAAFGPKNIITAVAHGHEAAVSIDLLLTRQNVAERPAPHTQLVSQKMGIHEWSYGNDITLDQRSKVPLADPAKALKSIKIEVELGFDAATALKEAERCLNCDVQTVFSAPLCIECDACVDICPMDSLTLAPNAAEPQLRQQLTAEAGNTAQALYVSPPLPTQRVMVKDEDVCLHCGLCAERCPTGAWDMQKFLLEMAHADSPKTRNTAATRKAAAA